MTLCPEVNHPHWVRSAHGPDIETCQEGLHCSGALADLVLSNLLAEAMPSHGPASCGLALIGRLEPLWVWASV